MKMRKTRLCMAVASTIAAASLTPTLSWGYSINVQDGTWSSNSAGDMLIYPVYTTGENGGTTTSFSMTNTSPTEVVITKIRFREQLRSMDAMDFDIVLSPSDKFNFTVSKQPGQRPVMGWSDKSCIVGPGQGATSYPFPVTNAPGGPGNNNSFVYDESALDAGHIEVLSMAALKSSDGICYSAQNQTVTNRGAAGCNVGEVNLATAATHVDGVPPNCAAVSAVLTSQALTNQLAGALGTTTPTADQNYPGDAPNSLTGRYVITVPNGGIEGGGDATALQNSNLPLSSQSVALCSAAVSNCTQQYNWDAREYDHPHLGDMIAPSTLANLEAGMEAVNVAGDWSNNPGNFVGVDWVLSFPTKYLYTQVAANPVPALGLANFTMLPVTLAQSGALPNPWPINDPSPFCLQTLDQAWGVDEESGTNQEVVSPSPTASLEFCNEFNVLTFDINGLPLQPSYVATLDQNGVSRRTVVNFDVSSANAVYNGWAALVLDWDNTANNANPASVGGIIYTVRDTDQANINNGSLTELQKNVGGIAGD